MILKETVEIMAKLSENLHYIINTLAERCIRPMTVERNSSLFFCNHKGAEISVIYYIFVGTCKLAGVSVLGFFKKFFNEVRTRRIDYENLLLDTIGIKA